jgi:hypothetical protein
LFADCVPIYLQPDALGPTLTAMLLPDFLQRFIPIGILPDRARALELAWQDAWRRNAPEKPENMKELLANPFASLWRSGPLPILLLNGTSVRTGRRIVTTNLDLVTEAGPDGTVFHDVTTFSSLTPLVISATTAVTNSARFPFISPPGTIPATVPKLACSRLQATPIRLTSVAIAAPASTLSQVPLGFYQTCCPARLLYSRHAKRAVMLRWPPCVLVSTMPFTIAIARRRPSVRQTLKTRYRISQFACHVPTPRLSSRSAGSFPMLLKKQSKEPGQILMTRAEVYAMQITSRASGRGS